MFASNKYGSLDLTSNLNVHNYDTNKFKRFLVNDLDWKFRTNNFLSGVKGNLIGKVKNDLITVNTPSGERNFEILDVEYT